MTIPDAEALYHWDLGPLEYKGFGFCTSMLWDVGSVVDFAYKGSFRGVLYRDYLIDLEGAKVGLR